MTQKEQRTIFTDEHVFIDILKETVTPYKPISVFDIIRKYEQKTGERIGLVAVNNMIVILVSVYSEIKSIELDSFVHTRYTRLYYWVDKIQYEDRNYQDELQPDNSKYEGTWLPYRSRNR